VARKTFPDDRSAYFIRGGAFRSLAGETATVYSDAGGTTLANIQTVGAVAIPSAQLTIDSDSRLPLFLGPDGVDLVYVVIDGHDPVPVYARVDDRLDSLETTSASNRVVMVGAGIDPTGATDSTVAIQAKLDTLPVTGGTAYFPAGIYSCATALTIANNTRLYGEGKASEIRYTASSGNFITLTNKSFVTFDSLRFRMYDDTGSGTCFYLDNSFRCKWISCIVDGKHFSTDTIVPASNANQTGFEFRNNAGDNRIVACDINNFGAGIRTSTIMNHLCGGSIIGTCLIGVYGDAGSFAAGMTISDVVFTSPSTAGYCSFGIKIDVAANEWWVSNVWIEGADVGIQIGSGANGPAAFSLINAMVAATTKVLDIQGARQTTLLNVKFGVNPAATPTALTINATNAAEGYAANLIDTQSFELSPTLFPPAWTYQGRITKPHAAWSRTIPVSMTAQAVTNWSAVAFDVAYPMSITRASSGAQNATISWDVDLSAGTWNIGIAHVKGTNRGIFTVAIDAVTVGTVDAYNGSPVVAFDAVTAVAVTVSGKHRVTLTMATKNASASSYFGTPSYLTFQRTA
jgi:hypothetical protein